MLAARMHEYKKPLLLEQVQEAKNLSGERVLVKVGGAGICRTDLQMIDGYFREYLDLKLPCTLGHEIAGWVEEIGDSVPENIIKKGDLVVVYAAWGCGVCPQCKSGSEQICGNGKWAGFGPEGGYSEFVLVPSYKYLIKVNKESNLKPEDIAPITDAGLTTYRAIRKVKHILGPGKSIAIIGMGGLGSYAVQYARILSAGSTVLAFDRNDDKLDLAKENGADHVINIKDKKSEDIRAEVNKATGRTEVNAGIDVVGTEESIAMGFSMLATEGAYVSSGLVGNQIKMPLFPLVSRELQYYGSFWGSYNDLREVMELAKKGLIKHHVQKFGLPEANDALDLLREGKILGRGVLVP
jgi:alcohol dehydrogenase, propanol-preferring